MFNTNPDFKKPVPREITLAVLAATGAAEARFYNRVQDPFGIESACRSPGGHVFIADGETIVCEHCSRLVWP